MRFLRGRNRRKDGGPFLGLRFGPCNNSLLTVEWRWRAWRWGFVPQSMEPWTTRFSIGPLRMDYGVLP